KVDIVTNHSLEIRARRFDLNLGVLTKETINGPIKISIYVSENNIIDAQETVGRIIPDYKHDHVLRHMLTAWDGDLLSQNLSKGSIINKRYSYTIPENYVLENLEVVIAVSSLTNREVLQAFKIDL
ncbi:MAG TPA: Omp28-related outer membrane protein, partial [Saprospiraceae bacterium]|nr:Omp28-related outer membrane protein [Saprospiraceae bacterium]